jgi:UDP-N-acetylmuramate--alanine ligase
MYTKKAHIHFVGIGGIGMSGIAAILAHQGYQISGCDADVDQHSIKDLQKLGCSIYHGNNTHFCNDTSIDILVYSSAIKPDNAEIVTAQQRGIPTIPRALMLAELMRTKYSIAVAGAHGKTTTTSLIAHILFQAHLDPTVIVGGHVKNFSTNARLGLGDFLVAEADESDRSFLYLHPTIALVTNIDLEHLETYTDLDDIKRTFRQFLSNLPFYGKAIICADNDHLRSILPIPHVKIISYGIEQKADIFATDIVLDADATTFTVHAQHIAEPLGTITLAIPGIHNVLNTLGAITLARDLNIPFATIAHALASFKGIERRFSYRGRCRGAEIFDDYGHHPQELYHTFTIARKRAKGKLIVAFQLHRYTRTAALWNHFIELLIKSPLDYLIITDIHEASEAPIAGITAAAFTAALQQHNPPFPVFYVPLDDDFAAITTQILSIASSDDLILLQGAGKIYKTADILTKAHQ